MGIGCYATAILAIEDNEQLQNKVNAYNALLAANMEIPEDLINFLDEIGLSHYTDMEEPITELVAEVGLDAKYSCYKEIHDNMDEGCEITISKLPPHTIKLKFVMSC
jgi:hypothetical protein